MRGLWAAVALAVGFGYLAIVLTFSRAAVLAALVAIGVGILVSRVRSRRYLLLVAAGIGVVVLFLVGSCGSDAGAGFGRSEEWRQTLEVIRDNPVWGVGLGRLGDVLHARNPASTAQHAHNLWLTWWGDAGTGALLAWVWIAIGLLWRSAGGARSAATRWRARGSSRWWRSSASRCSITRGERGPSWRWRSGSWPGWPRLARRRNAGAFSGGGRKRLQARRTQQASYCSASAARVASSSVTALHQQRPLPCCS